MPYNQDVADIANEVIDVLRKVNDAELEIVRMFDKVYNPSSIDVIKLMLANVQEVLIDVATLARSNADNAKGHTQGWIDHQNLLLQMEHKYGWPR